MKISKRAEYGLRAMVRLAKNNNKRAISIREISNMEGVPFEFLGKIFFELDVSKCEVASTDAQVLLRS